MLRLTLSTLFTSIVFVGFVISHPQNLALLEELESAINKLILDAGEKLYMIDYLEEGLNERLNNITVDRSTSESWGKSSSADYDTEAESEQNPVDRTNRIVSLYKRVELKLSLIKNVIAQEASVDKFLDGLDKKLNEDFPTVKEKVDAKTNEMDRMVDDQIDRFQTTLGTVDHYARSRNKDIAGAIYHGGIGSPCPDGNSECRLADSGCYGAVCHCDPGFSYDALLQQCVEECRFYGNTFQLIPNYIVRGYNTLILNETSIEECKAACCEAEDFECRSLEYFPRWRECFLSDAFNLTEVAWEHNEAGHHFQRDCAYY